MALKLCRQCGASISEEAQICPQCGAPNPTKEKIAVAAVVVIAVATFGMFFLSYARPVSPAPPVPSVPPVPHKEENLADKYANMTEQQLINSLPEDYVKALSRQKSDSASGIEPARTTREIVELVASSNMTKPDPKVVAIIDALIKLEEQNGPYIDSQGDAYLANKQYDLAIKKFDEAIRLGEMNSYFGRGMAWLAKQEYERAIADFTQAAKLEHENYLAYLHRAEANEQRGDRDSAIADYRRALVLAPDKAVSDQIKVILKRLGYVEFGSTPNFSGAAGRRNRR